MWPKDSDMNSTMKIGFYLKNFRDKYHDYYIAHGWNGEEPEDEPDFNDPEWNNLEI